MTGPRGLMRNGNFTRFWFGETVSLFGVRITALALPLTAMLVLAAGPEELGLLGFAAYLPYLLVALPFGVLVDRRRKRPLMIGANAVRAVLIGLVPVLAALGLLTLPALVAITLGIGACTVLFEVCWQSYIPVIVGKEHLVAANGRVTASWSAAESAGPGLGGLLVQLLTAPFALIANAVSYAVSVVSLWSIRAPEPVPEPSGRHMGKEILDGLALIVRQPYLRVIMVSGAAYNFFYVFLEALFVLYAVRVLGFGPGLIGLVVSLAAIGGVLGAAVAATLVGRLPFGLVFLAAELVSAGGPLLIPAASGPTVVAAVTVTAGFFVMRVGLAVSNTTSISLRQTVTPPELLGRMNASMRALMWGPQTVGALVGGFIGGFAGLRESMWIASAGLVLSVLPLALSGIPRIRRLTDVAPAPAPAPAGSRTTAPTGQPTSAAPPEQFATPASAGRLAGVGAGGQ
ncbi:MFS transporter [Nonomuraea jiangxiensis]|uniref:Transmembrane secretion effector n=1 Tax=Nonomuraea jiangxiensis TaxID=633440 RepID=A0A1G8ICA1_9ACTN|nr:MFS transporter [Nonomuraea jiangxiensis]SDI16482.1 Transmembrane secretion effector [Nonomuraea jiangxiensis]